MLSQTRPSFSNWLLVTKCTTEIKLEHILKSMRDADYKIVETHNQMSKKFRNLQELDSLRHLKWRLRKALKEGGQGSVGYVISFSTNSTKPAYQYKIGSLKKILHYAYLWKIREITPMSGCLGQLGLKSWIISPK